MTSQTVDQPPPPTRDRDPDDQRTGAQRALWGGVAIASMWLAVLCIGLWGGDIVSGANASSGQAGSTVPVVVVVAPCALIATIVIARRAFGDRAGRGSRS